MSKYKLVIFDMDGTLADTSPGIVNCVRYTQRKMNLPEISLEQMYSHVGPPMEESYNRNFGLTGDELKRAVEFHKEYAVMQGYKEIRWYDGIPELLDALRANGIVTAIATLKAHKTVLKILDHFDMTDKFDIVIGTSTETPMNKCQLLKYCIEKTGIPESNTVLVGDSSYDAVGAEECSIDFLAVTYGFGFKQQGELDLYKKIGVCKDAREISQIVM